MATTKKTASAKKQVKTAAIATGAEKLRERRAKKVAANAALKRTKKPAAKKPAAKKTVKRGKPTPEAWCGSCHTAHSVENIGTTCDRCGGRGVVEKYVEPAKQAATVPAVPATKPTAKPVAAAKPEAVKSEPLAKAEKVTVPLKLLNAALVVAPTDDSRYFLNGVYMHQVDGNDLRVVASDGHRMFIGSMPLEQKLDWGKKGVLIPRDHLARIINFMQRRGDCIDIEYGVEHPTLKLVEPDGIGTFKFAPIAGDFPTYAPVVDRAATAITEEREALSFATIDSKYWRSASAVASAVGSKSIRPYIPSDAAVPCVFTFVDAPEAMLIIMSQKAADDAVALPAATAKLFSKATMQETLKSLEARIARTADNAQFAKNEGKRELYAAKLERLKNRATELRAVLSVKLEGPKKAAPKKAAPKKAAPKLSVVKGNATVN